MVKVLVSIPIYITNELHYQFTEQTAKSIRQSETRHDIELLLVNNHCIEDYHKSCLGLGKVVNNPKGNNVSAAWNLGIKYGIKHNKDYVIVPNNDVIVHPRCIENLVKFAQEHREFALWTANEHPSLRTIKTAQPSDGFDEHPHFSFFMVGRMTCEVLKFKETLTKEPFPGYFDENFEVAYMEDNDYHQRLLRAGLKAGKTASALFYHFGSRTIKVDDKLHLENNITYQRNREYFKKKWGFDVHARVVDNNDPMRFKYRGPFGP